MNFSIERLQENGLSLLRLKDTHTHTTVDILPAYGAILHAFNVMLNGKMVNIIDGYNSKESIEQQLDSSYKGPKLSPFVCRIPHGKYEWQGDEYEILKKFKDGSAIHGLLYNKNFKISDEYKDDHKASVRLKYHYKKDDSGYPFDYVCEVAYILHEGNVLQAETTILNLDDQPIPIADGWHPYFTLGGAIDQYQLQFASDMMLEFDKELIPTGKIVYNPIFKERRLLGDQQLDNCFLLQSEDSLPVCTLYNPENQLGLSFFANNSYPYLQIYTPDHRKSIAIENLSGAPDCFNNGMGLKIIQPRHSETFNVWYKVQAGEIQ